MSSAAQTLANYFAAVDGEPFPYQKIPERDPGYLDSANGPVRKVSARRTRTAISLKAGKCSTERRASTAIRWEGRAVKVGDPKKDIRGPNLEYASDRLRPDWLMLWLDSLRWITPYTSMPQVFPKSHRSCRRPGEILRCRQRHPGDRHA